MVARRECLQLFVILTVLVTANPVSGNLSYAVTTTDLGSWNVQSGGTRVYRQCEMAVDALYQPQTKYFNISMGATVTNFEHYDGSFIDPASGASGSWFYITNKYHLNVPKFTYKFQATYPSASIPTIICYSEFPQYGATTTTSSTTESTTSLVTTTSGTTSGFNYSEVIAKSILFYRAQRSGDLPEDADDPVPWRKDSALYDGNDVGLDLTGGWYDAGDYVKFNLPISSAVTILAWGTATWKDAYQTANQYQEILDCIKWPLDFFLKCWRNDTEEFYAQVGNGTIDHNWMGRPEDMTSTEVPRPAFKVTSAGGGSDVAGTVAAAFAAGSIVFKTEDPTYSASLLDAARSLYSFADTYRAFYTVEVPDATEYYDSSDYKDDLVYAAAMLYKATGEAGYLTDAENKYQQFGFDYQTSWAFDWDNKLMAAKLLLFEATNNSIYSRDVDTFLNQWRSGGSVQYTPGGLAWRGQWGTLRYTANTAFIALMAAELGIDATANTNWAKGQIDYMLGDNPRQSSYVVGFGANPPLRPHHKSSICQPSPASCGWTEFSADTDNAYVLYGALVGGPNSTDSYVDDRTDYVMAEVTCDYNAGFQSAIAGLIHFDTQ